MLLFGHIGITAGAVKACDILASMTKPGNRERLRSRNLLNGIKGRLDSIDYRLVLLGSLLPDIIDKPVWFLVTGLTNDTALGGRDYAHSLLFNLVLVIGGLVLIGYRKSWLLIISLSGFMHLILDQMWNSPEILLWPLMGSLPELETAGWLPDLFQALFSYPEVYIPEIIGLVIIFLFACRLAMKRSVTIFVREGAIG